MFFEKAVVELGRDRSYPAVKTHLSCEHLLRQTDGSPRMDLPPDKYLLPRSETSESQII